MRKKFNEMCQNIFTFMNHDYSIFQKEKKLFLHKPNPIYHKLSHCTAITRGI